MCALLPHVTSSVCGSTVYSDSSDRPHPTPFSPPSVLRPTYSFSGDKQIVTREICTIYFPDREDSNEWLIAIRSVCASLGRSLEVKEADDDAYDSDDSEGGAGGAGGVGGAGGAGEEGAGSEKGGLESDASSPMVEETRNDTDGLPYTKEQVRSSVNSSAKHIDFVVLIWSGVVCTTLCYGSSVVRLHWHTPHPSFMSIYPPLPFLLTLPTAFHLRCPPPPSLPRHVSFSLSDTTAEQRSGTTLKPVRIS